MVFGKDFRVEQSAQVTDPPGEQKGRTPGGGGLRETGRPAHTEARDGTHMQGRGSTSALDYNLNLTRSSVA